MTIAMSMWGRNRGFEVRESQGVPNSTWSLARRAGPAFLHQSASVKPRRAVPPFNAGICGAWFHGRTMALGVTLDKARCSGGFL